MNDSWNKAEGIFFDAASRPAGERAAYVATACAGQVELQREVESLLEADSRGGAFLDTSLPEVLDATADPARAETADADIDRLIGVYRLRRRIGAGGMGSVYLARREDAYQQDVAIKLVKRGMDTDEILRRFRNERQVLANLEHPNIARLLDGGATDDGRPFLVMEYVDGEPITSYCDDRQLRVRERLEIFLKVCAAVEAAHETQIVHRDLKPANVLVTESGEPKLLDFGIAKLMNPDSPEYATAVTGDSTRLLTPEYASPEQVRGGRISSASDVYSLGVMLYELLTGSRPFTSRDGTDAMWRAICEEEPPRPSRSVSETTRRTDTTPTTRVPRLRRELAGDLDLITMTALRKEPARRYASAAALADDVSRHLAGQPISARNDAVWHRAHKFVFRNRAAVFGGVLAVLAVAVAAWALRLSVSRPADVRPALAVLPLVSIGGDPGQAYLADGLTDALISTLGSIDGLRVTSRTSAMAYKESPKLLSVIGEELGVGYVIEGSVVQEADRIRINTRLIDTASDSQIGTASYEESMLNVLGLQARIARRIAQRVNVQVSPLIERRLSTGGVVDPEAYRLTLQGRFAWHERTHDGFMRALSLFERAIEIDPDFAEPYAGLADTYSLLPNYGVRTPEEAMPLALAAAQDALARDDTLADAHNVMGRIAHMGYEFQEAERWYREAIRLNPSHGMAHKDLGLLLTHLGRFAEALAQMQLALEVDPLSLVVNMAAGLPDYCAGRYEESVRYCHRALEIDPDFVVARWVLIETYADMGAYQEAIDEFEGIERSRMALRHIGYAHARAGQTEAALAVLDELEPPEGPLPIDAFSRAKIHAALGDGEQALVELEAAYRARSTSMPAIAVHPAFAELRGDPRFVDLVARIGLPPLGGD